MEIREFGVSENWIRMPMDGKNNDLKTQMGIVLNKESQAVGAGK